MADQTPPMIDLPQPLDADVKALAEEMSDTDMKALVIQTFRFQLELIAFTRQVSATVDALGDNPMVSAMMAPMRRGNSGLIRPGNGG